jgi:DNA-binding transcriptional regulator YdaS (Cro superfamily)
MTPIEKCAQALGISKAALADRLGMSRQRVSSWKYMGIPAKHCYQLEQLTEGKVTRKEMRPTDWQHYWPELGE